ncbi:DUF6090 family protein [Winogradskyella sp. A3E31]|uniref:DUF6090 family protein n=1 Tax=Winogradskyella sp. A3E31 TaxID=3349637 RepID=UPI00398B8BFB
MIKFFRKIRYDLMEQNKTGKYFKYAIGEIVLVVIGILIALSINNWNESRKEAIQEQFILKRLRTDISSDINQVSLEIDLIDKNTKELKFCIDVMLDKKEASIEAFRENLESMLNLSSFDQNKTTFNNIISSGQIEYIKNQNLTDSITVYYNYRYQGWDTAMLDYTRNIIAPFILNFDHTPQATPGLVGYDDFTRVDIMQSKIPPKTIEDYRNEIFVLNMLRQKLYNLEGQKTAYNMLKITMLELIEQIDVEIED